MRLFENLDMKCATVGFLVLLAAQPSLGADSATEFGRNYPAFSRGQFTTTARTSYDPNKPPDTITVWRVHIDPPRWKLATSGSTTTIKDGKASTYSSWGESVVHESGEIVVSADKAGRIVGGVAAYVKPLPQNLAKKSGYGPYCMSLDSRITWNNHQSLPTILSLSKIETRTEKLGQIDTIELTATGAWGKHILWLDPARNYLPLKVIQEKLPADLIDDEKPLRSIVKDPNEKPPATATKLVQQFDTTKIETVAGRRMVTGFTNKETIDYSDGTQEFLTQTVSITGIKPVQVWEKDPFVMTTIIPDGTRVTAQDDKPIQYEWRGGKIVKAVNKEAVASAGSHVFVPPVQRDRTWLWLSGAIAVVIAGIVAWWRVRAGRVA